MKERAFEEAANALKAGEIVCIFPEGKLTDTGELNPFRPGLQRILEQAPAPVVPMALARTVGQLLQPFVCGQGHAQVAWRVFAHRAGGGLTGAGAASDSRIPPAARARIARRLALVFESTRWHGSAC